MAEVTLREEIRGELIAELQGEDARLASRDKRITASVVTFGLALCMLAPLVGLVIGAAVRAYHWAAGQ